MSILKFIVDFFGLEGGTRPHIVNVARPKMLFNYGLFFLFRKFNFIKLPYKPVNLMVEVPTQPDRPGRQQPMRAVSPARESPGVCLVTE